MRLLTKMKYKYNGIKRLRTTINNQLSIICPGDMIETNERLDHPFELVKQNEQPKPVVEEVVKEEPKKKKSKSGKKKKDKEE